MWKYLFYIGTLLLHSFSWYTAPPKMDVNPRRKMATTFNEGTTTNIRVIYAQSNKLASIYILNMWFALRCDSSWKVCCPYCKSQLETLLARPFEQTPCSKLVVLYPGSKGSGQPSWMKRVKNMKEKLESGCVFCSIIDFVVEHTPDFFRCASFVLKTLLSNVNNIKKIVMYTELRSEVLRRRLGGFE